MSWVKELVDKHTETGQTFGTCTGRQMRHKHDKGGAVKIHLFFILKNRSRLER